MKVCMILADGFEEMEAMGSFSVINRGGVEVDLYGLNGTEATGRHGLKVCGLKPFSSFDMADYAALVLPGGPHYAALEASQELKETINKFLSAGRKVAAICASPTILGHMGLLKGKNYTCYTAMNEDFGGAYKEDQAVTDGNIITGKGPAAAIDFALEVVKQLKGENTAEDIKKGMYYR